MEWHGTGTKTVGRYERLESCLLLVIVSWCIHNIPRRCSENVLCARSPMYYSPRTAYVYSRELETNFSNLVNIFAIFSTDGTYWKRREGCLTPAGLLLISDRTGVSHVPAGSAGGKIRHCLMSHHISPLGQNFTILSQNCVEDEKIGLQPIAVWIQSQNTKVQPNRLLWR